MKKMKKLHLNILWILMLVIFVVPCYSASAPLIEENLKEALVKKDWDKVIETANTWKKQDKTTLVPYLALAYAYYVKGDYQKVSQSLGPIDSQEKKKSLLVWAEEFSREYPQNSIPYLLKGDVSIRLRKYSVATKEFDKAEELDQSFFLVYVAKGMLYSFQNNHDLAVKNFTEAIKLEPNLADIYNSRGAAYFSKDNYTLALDDFNQAIKIKPEFSLAYLGRGKVYHSLGKDDLASSDFQKAKEINREGITFSQQIVQDPSGRSITQKSWHAEFGGGGGKIGAETTNIPFMKNPIAKASISSSLPKIGGVDSEPKGKTKKIRKGEVVSEKTPDDNYITSASYFLLYRDQFLFKEKGE